jgi:hypothetical protein
MLVSQAPKFYQKGVDSSTPFIKLL